MHELRPAILLLLLAIDDVSLPLRKNVCLYLSKPEVRAAPVLEPSPVGTNAPDNLAAHFYGTVLHDRAYDGAKFRLWYYACHRGANPDWPPRKAQQVAKKPTWLKGIDQDVEVVQGPLCYAESDDGIAWRKPSLGQVLFKGSRENNALDLPHTIVSGAAVIRDDSEPDIARRYKMVYQYFPDQTDPPIKEYGSLPSIACAVSPDGLKWSLTALPFVNQFVEHCSLIRHAGKYIVHSQVFSGTGWGGGAFSEGGTAGGRAGVAHATYDFNRWPDLWQWAFTLPEPADQAARGTYKDQLSFPQVHLGVGAASFGNVCVGVYGLWHDRKNFADISGDLGLAVSNDGVRFRELSASPARPFIRREDSPAPSVEGRNFNTILCQGNGILNVGDQTRIYHGRWRNVGQVTADVVSHYRAEVALATLRRDRWGWLALNPGAQEGSICSMPIDVPGHPFDILLNADGCRGMRVELLDERLQPIEGFSGADAGRVDADGGLDCLVQWATEIPSTMRGRPVRVLVTMQKPSDAQSPQLYAIALKARQ
ncbi:MAG: hypothetical protein NTY25_11500 [Planctomycetia bacterium]|nr:hypothetical protein [Planctomycetia bacterium]